MFCVLPFDNASANVESRGHTMELEPLEMVRQNQVADLRQREIRVLISRKIQGSPLSQLEER